MGKVLSFSSEQYFNPFSTLLVERSSEKGLFKHLSNNFFPSPYVEKCINYEGQLFFENVQN